MCLPLREAQRVCHGWQITNSLSCLADNVRSLFLPGSHEHKVSYLGASLQNFCRLKNLDLSCNTLASLEGLHTLQCLEKLNLYYNRLPDLTELFRLRHNQKLIEVDLRLNPVASHDPQYRLFLVRLLPALERLDDMAVMPSERAASASVFTTVCYPAVPGAVGRLSISPAATVAGPAGAVWIAVAPALCQTRRGDGRHCCSPGPGN